MNRVASIFSQILQLFPRSEFEQMVRQHEAEHHARGFTCWGQLVAMLFCQLGRAHSLREICNGLAASEGKLQHLGLPGAPSRSTLSYANSHRPWQLFREVFGRLYERCVEAAQAKGEKKFSLPGKLLSMDSTMISVCTSIFDWAHHTRCKGAVKLHLLLDHDGYLPRFAAMLIVRYLRLRARFGWSLSNLVALLRQQLFVLRPLWEWLNQPYQAPPAISAQMPLWEGGSPA